MFMTLTDSVNMTKLAKSAYHLVSYQHIVIIIIISIFSIPSGKVDLATTIEKTSAIEAPPVSEGWMEDIQTYPGTNLHCRRTGLGKFAWRFDMCQIRIS